MHVGWLSACTIFFCFLVQDRFVNALPWSVALMFNWQITSELKDREFVFLSFFPRTCWRAAYLYLDSWYEWCSRLGTRRNFRQYQITFWSTARTSLGSDHGPTSVELLQHLFIQNGISFEKSVAPNPLEHMADILKTKAQGAIWILLFSFDSSAQNWYSEQMQFKSTKVCSYPKFTLHLFYNVYSFTHLCRIKLL